MKEKTRVRGTERENAGEKEGCPFKMWQEDPVVRETPGGKERDFSRKGRKKKFGNRERRVYASRVSWKALWHRKT